MSTNFQQTRRGNPCELCDDTTGKCRQTETTQLCMTLTEALDTAPGFIFIGRTKDDRWGKWVEDQGQDWSDTQREQWRYEQQQIKAQRAWAEAQRRADALSPLERDQHYRPLLNQLSLHPADRQDLARRGFTDAQIQASGFKSVVQWQRLESDLPHTLPGVNLDSRSLNVSGVGYLCPLQDVAGLIVGCQLRLRASVEGGRYRWLTSATKKRPHGSTPHLPNGELPLAVHRPDTVQRPAIALVEGTGAKPFLLAQRQGQVTIGAAGGQFASSPQTLQATLVALTTELGTTVIEFYPDADAVGNRHVLRQYRATWKLLRQWGYTVQVAWWGQETKAAPDIDELDDPSVIEWLTTAQLEALAHPRATWLEQIQRRLQRSLPPTRAAFALQRTLAGPEPEMREYLVGTRHAAWQQARSQGYRYILDQSATGTGKSFEAGLLEPSGLGLRQLMYVSDQHRNPTVETLTLTEGWVDLEARHAGLSQETTPGGGSRVKRTASGDTPSTPANCHRTRLIGALRAKSVQGADTASLLCGTCPLREACTHAEGPGYGFLNQRHAALSAPQLRAHPDSLPQPTDYDYAETGLLWDEPGQSWGTKRDVLVTLADLEQTLLALLRYPTLLEAVQPLFTTLLPYLQGHVKLGRFGLSHAELVPRLSVPVLDPLALEQVLQPDLSFLNTTAVHGVDLADLPAGLRKQFSARDSELAEQAQQRVLKQWLPDLLRVLSGQLPGAVRLESSGLTLSLADTRHRAIAQAGGVVIFLDATLSRQDLALKLGCAPEEIYVCRQRVPVSAKLTVTQVVDLGRLGLQRGADQQRRVAALITHYQTIDPETKVIDFKRFTTEGMGAWWRDSRGVNDFTTTKTLLLVGTPCRNLAESLAEYALLTGVHEAEDAGFQAFVERAILADLHQAIGRLRAHRRPDETLQVILLSDFALDHATQPVKASALTLEAACREERLLLAAQAAVAQLRERGEKVTQTAIAAMTGYSQQRLSQIWKLLLLLLESSNSKSSKKASAALKPSDEELITGMKPVLSLLVTDCQDVALMEAVSDLFLEWLTPRQRIPLWQSLSIAEQIRVLSALLLALPTELLAALEEVA